jgi:RecA/RadA recombinase
VNSLKTSSKKRERLTTGISGLDSMLGGGLLQGSAVLVSGAPGVGKTTLGLQYLVTGASLGVGPAGLGSRRQTTSALYLAGSFPKEPGISR